ncbi:hypothetical protein PAUR_a2574 [Pseudoalteromonas aurantia 208]|uniref:Uncharacterized protein n=1 Tax=Pseudoalteromonas aurantia 208 TaxID=1314867 RepID=A0ABR9EDF0_9GAMM|nr:hypothetical protein [Pseudoalteromonas aurantia 208]
MSKFSIHFVIPNGCGDNQQYIMLYIGVCDQYQYTGKEIHYIRRDKPQYFKKLY